MEFSSQPWDANYTTLTGRLRTALAVAALAVVACGSAPAWGQAANDAKSAPAAATATADDAEAVDAKADGAKDAPAAAVTTDDGKGSARTPSDAPPSEPIPLGKDVLEEAGGVTSAGVIKLLVVLAIFIIPTIVGYWLARVLRMQDHGWKFAVGIGSVLAAAIVVATGEIKLGPDLSGGITLIYELAEDADAAPEQAVDGKAAVGDEGDAGDGKQGQIAREQSSALARNEKVQQLIGALVKRVDPSGTREVTIRKYGDAQVEIIIPHAEKQDLDEIERKISTAGALEFRIVASEQFSGHANYIDLARRLPPGENVVRLDGGVPVARWVEFNEAEFGTPEQARSRGLVVRVAGKTPQALVMVGDGLDVTGKYLRQTIADIDETGRPQVSFTFDSQGAALFGRLTGGNLPNPSGEAHGLGILLDNRLLQAPSIQSKITDRGRISGGAMTQKDVDFIVDILNAGSLPTALNKDPISRSQISPTIGKETVRKGKIALTISLAVVAVFMIAYYKTAGVIATIGLALNMLLILGVMVLIKGAFTLPGLAGLVLTVGMSVDANVLINERIREELKKGAALRMAIRNGYSRAWVTIFDSNVTNLITAAVIYKIAPDNVKGFGITLIIGILMSVFSAVFLTRLIFDVAERRGWIKSLPMREFIGETHIDFLSYRWWAIGGSAALIAIGLFAAAARKSDLFDIDFTGGSSVTFVLDEDQKMDYAEVYDTLMETELGPKNLSLVEMGDTQTQYTVTTIVDDVGEVQDVLTKTFGEKLKTYRVTVENVRAVDGESAAVGWLDRDALPWWSQAPLPAMQVGLLQAGDSAAEEAEEAATEDDEATAAENDEVPAEQSAADEATDEATDEADNDNAAAEESPGDEPADGESDADDAPADAVADPFAGGSQADFTFTVDGEEGEGGGVNHTTIDTLVKNALADSGNEGVASRVSNPDYTTDSIRNFKNWTVSVALPLDKAREVFTRVEQQSNNQPDFPLSNKIGGRVAGRMAGEAIAATVLSLAGVVAYVWFRFHRAVYGFAAVVALIHDVLMSLGFVAVSAYFVQGAQPLAEALLVDKFQVGLTLVAAFLTIIGYSLNDTIVVFDRIREIKGKSPRLTAKMINDAVNQTLARTLLTSFTTFMTITVLYLFGGEGIHGFAFAMLVGIIAGSYSTIFIANPMLLWMAERADRMAGESPGSRAA